MSLLVIAPVRCVNGHENLQVGGQLTSRYADTKSPGGRTAFLPVGG